jgi:hypothetical protein
MPHGRLLIESILTEDKVYDEPPLVTVGGVCTCITWLYACPSTIHGKLSSGGSNPGVVNDEFAVHILGPDVTPVQYCEYALCAINTFKIKINVISFLFMKGFLIT